MIDLITKQNFTKINYFSPIVFLTISIFLLNGYSLEKRKGPLTKTTEAVPHMQLNIKPVPKVHKELFRRVFKIEGIENRPTIISLPGARGLWINDSISLKHPEVIVVGREFAHIHPDGSLHISLEPKRAKEAVKKGWAEPHPWSNKRKGLEGFVMLFTPQNMEELDIVVMLIKEGYNYVRGIEKKSK